MRILAVHLKEATIIYTGKIVLTPTKEIITLAPDTKTEIAVWNFK